MKQQKLRKIGNSIGVIIPKEILEKMNLKDQSTLYLKEENNVIYMTKDIDHTKIDSNIMKLAEQIINDYKEDFQELATK